MVAMLKMNKSYHKIPSKRGKRPAATIWEPITKLGPYDILCGRCCEAYHNIGNRRFRVTIELNLAGYQSTPTRRDRSKFIISLVHTLRNDTGARFMRKEGNFYVEIGEKEARNKVGHALRDAWRMAQAQQESTIKMERKISSAMAMAQTKLNLNKPTPLGGKCIPDNCSSKAKCVQEPQSGKTSEEDYDGWLTDWFSDDSS